MRRENLRNETPLPSGYTRLNYIESTGTQYIDTGYYVGNKKTRIVADFVKTSPLYQQGVLFACCSPSDNQAFFNPYYGMGGANNWVVIYGLGRVNVLNFLSRLNTHITFDVTVDIPNSSSYSHIEQGTDVFQFTATTSTIYNNSLALFAQHFGTSFNAKISAQLYQFEIHENDTLVHNYIPALRDLDSKPGLYDVAAGEFKTNNGTGEFLYA